MLTGVTSNDTDVNSVRIGVSKNVRPFLRPPHFEEAAFLLQGSMRVDVRIGR